MLIQLFIDTGAGLSEEQSILQKIPRIGGGYQSFTFDLSGYSNITALRIDPLMDSVIINVQEISVKMCSGESVLINQLGSNATAIDENKYFFETIDPQIYLHQINKEDLKDIQQLTLQLRYLCVGQKARQRCKIKTQGLNYVYQSIQTSLRDFAYYNKESLEDFLMKKSKCDVIVPIYNALDSLIVCINSVINNTDPNIYRLILINDKSPDNKIEEYLTSIKIDNPHIVVLNNEENLGFVKTVNKGMLYSDNDVVLLNSDTIVTKGWLDKIKRAAYFRRNVATVTPLTNNGTICSVPQFCQDNVIPEGFTLEEFASLIEQISFKKYPTIPTAIGFCMYIKRRVINELGLFDDISFGKGYGEENDFCCRAIEKGYINILCDDAFVYHQGSMSFKEEKLQLIEANSKTLAEKHPGYFSSVAAFIQENPLKDIQNIIRLNIALRNGKRNILYILHNYSLSNGEGIFHPLGGTEHHLKDLTENLSSYNKFVLVSSAPGLILQAYLGEEDFYFNFNIGESLEYSSFHSENYEKTLESILKGCNIDLIHVQHFLRHTLDIPKVAKKLNIPCVITLHDFYSICPTIYLLDANNVYCHETRNKDMCHQCMRKRIGYDGEFLKQWNSQMRVFLDGFDKIYAPSHAAKNIIEDYYGDLKIKVIEHGTHVPENKKFKDQPDGKFKVAFIGVFAPHKGTKIIESLIQENKNKNIEWHLFGNGEVNLPANGNATWHGIYARDKIINIVKELGVHLVCNFSICPETFSYTLTDAWLIGVPVLVHDIGALGERVKSHQGGWTIPVGLKPSEILDEINKIAQNHQEYQLKSDNVKRIKFKTNLEMMDAYRADYDALLINNNKTNVVESFYSHYIYNACNPLSFLRNRKDGFASQAIKFLKRILPQPFKNTIKRWIWRGRSFLNGDIFKSRGRE